MEGADSAASLAEERVTLRDMSERSIERQGKRNREGERGSTREKRG